MAESSRMLYAARRRAALRGAGIAALLAGLTAVEGHAQSTLITHSKDGRTAWAVTREGSGTLTEVYVADREGIPRRLKLFPGRPEGIGWDGDRLRYADRGLTLPVVTGGAAMADLEIVLAPGRQWTIPEDGGEAVAVAEGQKILETGRRGDGETETQLLSDASTLPFSVSRAGAGLERGAAAMAEGVSLAMMAYSAAQGGDFKGASSYYRQSAERFEAMPATVGEIGLSKAVCRSYAEALRRKGKADRQQMGRDICENHLKAIGGGLKGYAKAHDGHFPADLGALKAWVEQQYVRPGDTGQGAVSQIFRSPVDVNAGISYGYRPPDPADRDGSPVVWSYFYPGRAVELVRSGDGFRVIDRPLGQAQVDSLLGVGLRHMEADSPAVAVRMLEAVTRVAPGSTQAYTRLGYACLKAGDLDRAEASFQKAISLDGRLAEAYYGAGLVFTKRPRGLYAAIDRFQDALKWNPKYVEARYHIAEARLKMGEFDARREAEKVIAQDPKFAPVYRLMGEWYEEQQEDYETAAVWYTRYMALKPDDPEARTRLGRVYLKARDFERITQLLMDHVQQHPEEVHALPILAQACMEMKRLDWAQTFFKRYLDRIDPAERTLYEDIRQVAYPEEMTEYEAALKRGEREAFLKWFWAIRDPNLLTPVNERLLEHYRRVWYARQNFAARKQPWDRRGDVYIRLGEPDYRSRSSMINLRQSLEVQRIKERIARDIFGEEAANTTYFGPVFPVRSLRMTLSDAPNLKWDLPDLVKQDAQAQMAAAASQQRTRETKVGTIQDDNTSKQTTNGPGTTGSVGTSGKFESDMQLEAVKAQEDIMPSMQARPLTLEERAFGSGPDGQYRTDYLPVTAQEDASQVKWESWVYTRVGGGIEITFTDENGNGAFDYAPPPLDAHIPVNRMNKFNFYAPQKVFERAAAATVDHYMPRNDAPPLRFYYDLADFRGTQEGRSAVEVYYGMPHSTGCYFPEPDSTRMVVDRQVAFLDLVTGATYRTQRDLVFVAAGDMTRQQGGFIPDVARLEVPPGKYRMEVSARDRLTGRMGVYRQDVEVGDYDRGRLRLSGLELAWQVSDGQDGDKFTKRGMRVIPLPTRTFRKGQGIFVYYEVYNLKRDALRQTSHTVEYTVRSEVGGILSRIARTFVGKRPEVAVSQGQAGTEEAEYRYLELDLKGLTPGKGILTVTVKDLNSGEAVRRELAFMMAE